MSPTVPHCQKVNHILNIVYLILVSLFLQVEVGEMESTICIPTCILCDTKIVIEEHKALQWHLLDLFLAKHYYPLIWLHKMQWKFN